MHHTWPIGEIVKYNSYITVAWRAPRFLEALQVIARMLPLS